MQSSSNWLGLDKQAISEEQTAQLQPYSEFKILVCYKWKSHMHGVKHFLYYFNFINGKNGSHHDLIFEVEDANKKSCLKLGFASEGLFVKYYPMPYQKLQIEHVLCPCEDKALEETIDLANSSKYVKDLIFFLNTLTGRVYKTGPSKDQWDCQNFARTVINYLMKKCQKGHKLTLAFVLPSNYPNGEYRCNMCGTNNIVSKKDKVLRCSLCMYDVCPTCATSVLPKPEMNLKCKKKHQLVLVKHKGPFQCNKCSCMFSCSGKYQTLRCGACNYDICYACHKIK